MNTPPFLRRAGLLLVALFPALLFAQHGHGPDMKPLPVAEKAAVVSYAEGVPADAATTAFFHEFAEALRTHDGKPFLPRLAPNFTIPGFDGPDMKAGFVMAMTMITSPEAIVIASIEPAADGTRLIKTEFKYPKRTAKREFTLNAEHQLVVSTLIAMRKVPAGDAPRGH